MANKYSFTFLIFTLGVAYSTSAGAVIIDDFTIGETVVARLGTEPVTETQNGLNPANVIGGSRSFTVGAFGAAPQTLSVQPALGQMRFQTGDALGYFSVRYGSADSPLNSDFLSTGGTAFVLDVESSISFAPFTIYVNSSTGADTGGRVTSDLMLLPNGLTRVSVPFDQYSGVDFSSVSEIELSYFRFSPNSQITFHQFSTVPEPTGAASLAMLLMLWSARRNRQFDAG